MGYITFMVQMEPGRSNAAMLQATRYMAERFQAHVVGTPYADRCKWCMAKPTCRAN